MALLCSYNFSQPLTMLFSSVNTNEEIKTGNWAIEQKLVLGIGWDFINNKYIIIASLKDFDRWLIKWSMISTSQVVVYITLWFSFILCLMYVLLFHVLVIYHAFIFFNINTHSLKDNFDLQHLHQQAWNCKVL